MFDEYAAQLSPHSIFGDSRINGIFPEMISQLGNNFGKSLPQSSQDNAQMQSFYGFFSSSFVQTEPMLLAERDRLNEYFAAIPPMTVLAVQDTTDLDLTGKRVSGKIGSLNYAHRKGYYVHNHLLFDTKGIGLGLFDQDMWSRQAEYFGQNRSLWPLEDKESHRWLRQFLSLQAFFAGFPQHTAVDICDREGDFYEMFQARSAANVHLLIRSNKDKELASGEKLWPTLAAQTAFHIYKAKDI